MFCECVRKDLFKCMSVSARVFLCVGSVCLHVDVCVCVCKGVLGCVCRFVYICVCKNINR